MNDYTRLLKCEWLKTRNTIASWMVITGAFFIPLIMIFISWVNRGKVAARFQKPLFWENYFTANWQIMAILLLPFGIILATSLITQIEYRNNAWKQVHVMPISTTVIFTAKLTIIIVMMLQFFLLFNIGIYLSAIAPLLFSNAVYPAEPFPFAFFTRNSTLFFIDCMPVIALQYVVSLLFRNFLVPLCTGVVLLVAGMFAIQWTCGYLLPYSYTTFHYLRLSGATLKSSSQVNIHVFASGYCLLFLLAGYVFFIMRRDRC